MKEAEAWHCGRPGEATGEGAVSGRVEGSGLKRSCREVQAWHHEESLGEVIGENHPSFSRRLQHFGEPSTMGDDHQEQQPQGSGAQKSLEDKLYAS